MRSAFALILTLFSLTLHAQDWNQWRGPSRTGVTTTFVAPAAWPERPKQVWKVQAGIGHSSPVVSGTRVFLFSRIGEQEALTAYDIATGKQIWRQAYDAPYTMNSAATSHGKGPKSTPLVHRGRVYTLGISGTLSALRCRRWACRVAQGLQGGVRRDVAGLRRRDVARRRRRPRDRPRGWKPERRDHGVRRGVWRGEVGMEGRRAGVRVARRRDARRNATARDPNAIARRRTVGSRREAALGDPVRDRLRAEHHHPRHRRHRHGDLRGTLEAHRRRADRAGRREVDDDGALAQRRDPDVHEFTG